MDSLDCLANCLVAAGMLQHSFDLGRFWGSYDGHKCWEPGCGMDPAQYRDWTLRCDGCGSLDDYFMVRDEVWFDEAGLEEDWMSCIPCLEERLGRKLVLDDFPDYPVNISYRARYAAAL